MRSARLLLPILVILLIPACGPVAQNIDPHAPSPETSALQVGPDEKQKQTNSVTFAPILAHTKQTKYLVFKAPHSGKLVTQNGPFPGLVWTWGCPDQKSGTMDTQWTIQMKDSTTGAFSIAEADPIPFSDPVAGWSPRFSLHAGDEIRVQIDLESQVACERAELSLYFAFQAGE